MADSRRLVILFDDNPIDADIIITPRDLASDYPLAAATHFSTFCATRFAMDNSSKDTTPAAAARPISAAEAASKPKITISAPRHQFEYYQEAFRFIFDFYCQGTASLDGSDMSSSFLHRMMVIAKKLDIQILKTATLLEMAKQPAEDLEGHEGKVDVSSTTIPDEEKEQEREDDGHVTMAS